MRLVDTRFSGIARGVGTANILGRVHSAPLKLSDLFLPCSFTIMEVCIFAFLPVKDAKELKLLSQGREVDLLFGLDMLKAHQACIDLEKNVLRIQGREVRFLSEHELPDKARDPEPEPGDAGPSSSTPSGNNTNGPAFPGSGQALGTRPSTSINPVRRPPTSARPSQSRLPEKDIAALMAFGVTREVAISSLEAAGGNVEVAASFLF
jgi:DNA damage-inducible protein 1